MFLRDVNYIIAIITLRQTNVDKGGIQFYNEQNLHYLSQTVEKYDSNREIGRNAEPN